MDYENFTVIELKKLLKEKNLKVSGKKSELIKRLKETSNNKKIEINSENLENHFVWEDHLDSDHKVPVLDEINFKKMIDYFPDKNKRTESLVKFLISVGPSLVPRNKEVNLQSIEKLFKKAYNSKISEITAIPVLKHQTYDFDIGKCLMITQLGNQYNDISDFFQRDNRMKCGGYNRISPADAWNKENEKALTGIIETMWRLCSKNKLTISDYTGGTRLSSTVYMAAQFKVHVAVKIYQYFNAKNVIDFSMGWGDRIAGWFCANQGNEGIYYGCDPNVDLHKGYDEQIKNYSKWSVPNTKLKVHHYQNPAEDIDWDIIKDNSIDLIFTSPPYSDTERYAYNSEYENLQSWKRYPTTSEWYDKFLGNVIKKLIPKLKVGGIMAINIIDPEKNKKREKVCDKVYKTCIDGELKYEGYIGMRMKQRPKIWTGSSKEQFMSAVMVEPIWVFKK